MSRSTRVRSERVRSERVRSIRARVPPSSAVSVPIDTSWLTYLDADDGPVLSGSDVTDWLTLAGSYDWDQTGSADRGQYTTTTFSGSRASVDYDGSSDFMETVTDLASELDGTGVAFLRYMHFYIISIVSNGQFGSVGSTGSNARYDLCRQKTTAEAAEVLRRGASAVSATGLAAGVVGVGEHTFVERLHGTTKTVHIDGTKVLDAAAYDAGNISSLNTCTMAAWRGSSALQHANISVRRFGIRLGAGTDGDAATLFGKHGT